MIDKMEIIKFRKSRKKAERDGVAMEAKLEL